MNKGFVMEAGASILALGMCAMPVAAAAQGDAPAAAPAVEAGATDTGGDIVVTAQRRSESLQRVPISITAIEPERLEQLNLRSIDALQTVTPSLVFGNGQGFSQTFIRGIGTQFPTPGLEGSVATYVDGAYLERGIGTVFDLLDTSTIQILNGPQGTLYGRNATGGAIILNSADPTDKFEGHFVGEYGRFDRVLGEAVVNLPISDTLSFRFAGRYTDEDGYIRNITLDKMVPGKETYVARGKLAWRPTDDFSAVLTLEQSRTKSGTLPHVNRIEAPYCLGCAIIGQQAPSGFYQSFNDLEGPDSVAKSQSANLRIRMTDGIFTLESVTAYRDLFNKGTNDLDGTPVSLFNYENNLGGKTFTQDITVSSDSGSWFDGTVGISYLHDKGYFFPRLEGGAFAALVPIAGDFPEAQNFVRTESIAAFAEAILRPNEQLKFTIGGRYTYDDRRIQVNENLAANLAFTGGLGPLAFQQSASFSSFTPRFVANLDLDAVNLYASYNRGFKSGGISSPLFAPAPVVRPEKIDSFEVGAKFVSPDRRLRANVSAFYYKHKDLQVTVIDLTVGGSVVRNAARARGKGVEFDANYKISDGFEIFGGGAYLDAKFVSFEGASVGQPTPTGLVPGFEDLSGFTTPRSPKWTGFIGTNVEVPLGSWTAGFNAVGRYSAKYDFYPGAGGPLRFDSQPETFIVNASFYVGPADGNYQVGFYVNNLTGEKYYIQRQTSAPFGVYDDVAAPRTYGVRVKYSF